jgi:hypothetical protein
MAHSRYTSVSGFKGLTQFGINSLTGESCAYGMRMLCDVSDDGRALLADYFGMPSISLEPNWNSVVGDQPATGSIMLAHDIVRSLAQFAFFRRGALAVLITEHEVNGIFTSERVQQYRDFIEHYPNTGHSLRVNHALSSAAPMVGSRNIHAMSSRAS